MLGQLVQRCLDELAAIADGLSQRDEDAQVVSLPGQAVGPGAHARSGLSVVTVIITTGSAVVCTSQRLMELPLAVLCSQRRPAGRGDDELAVLDGDERGLPVARALFHKGGRDGGVHAFVWFEAEQAKTCKPCRYELAVSVT